MKLHYYRRRKSANVTPCVLCACITLLHWHLQLIFNHCQKTNIWLDWIWATFKLTKTKMSKSQRLSTTLTKVTTNWFVILFLFCYDNIHCDESNLLHKVLFLSRLIRLFWLKEQTYKSFTHWYTFSDSLSTDKLLTIG